MSDEAVPDALESRLSGEGLIQLPPELLFEQMAQEAARTRSGTGATSVVPIFVEMSEDEVAAMASSGEVKLWPGLWKVKEVAELLRVSTGMVYAWIKRGDVGVVRTPGGRIRIPAEVVEWLLRTQLLSSEDSPLT
jgi:excisionase family DNA binding protein